MTSVTAKPQAKLGNETRAELIRVGSDIIARRGFNSTGINVVLKEAGVPKGSFYYYFASKEDFGLAVIDDFAADYEDRLNRTLGNAELAPLERIRQFLEEGMADMTDCDCCRGCLAGNLGQELAGQNEAFRQRLDGLFNDWQARFARCLDEARERGDIDASADTSALAQLLQMGWQGATLRAKVSRSVTPMQGFADMFFRQVLGARARH
ncbi:TetR/AcrR family transcriptional regulator [Marinobacter bohaiensis]|uniref:TetR/AcrR family transcriptional regulator n=1 Tax=Marinobacter bohaiensis TaxID=2201898 RepID=UPI000DAC76EF|nr:TetR/AcrR family transcriptional regulator [Marinobacter bohaiensis]